MGWGDDILTTGIVKKARLRTNRPICVGDGQQVHWSAVYDGNPHISREIVPNCIWVKSAPGLRPYITKIHEWGYEYNDWKAEPGELFLTDEECDWPEGYIYIEPNIKAEISKNKDWGFARWQEVARKAGRKLIQGPGPKLEGVEQVTPKSFRHACGLLARCSAFIGTDGGLHHAAAALGKKAVVVWTGFSSPKNLGYDFHINLQAPVKACGRFKDCEHCRKAAQYISPQMVLDALDRVLRPELQACDV